MALLSIFEAAQDVAGNINGITTAYRLPPEIPPEDNLLPAVVFAPVQGEIEWGQSLEIWSHDINLFLLTKRGGDVQSEYAAIIPLVEAIVAGFRTETTLGVADVYAFHPVDYEIATPTLMQTMYVGARIGFSVKEKHAVTLG